MEKYLDGEEPDVDTLKRVFAKAPSRSTSSNLLWFSIQEQGRPAGMDGVVSYLPSPTEVKPQPEVDLEGNETGDFAEVDAEELRALAFKSWMTVMGHDLPRIYSGKLQRRHHHELVHG